MWQMKSLQESDFFGHDTCQGLTSLTYTAHFLIISCFKITVHVVKLSKPPLGRGGAGLVWLEYSKQGNCKANAVPHDSREDRIAAVGVDRLSVSGQPWAAYPEGLQSLSDQNRKTCSLTFPEARLLDHHQTQLLFLLLPDMPLLWLQTGYHQILCKLQMCSDLRAITVAVPSAWTLYVHLLPPSASSQLNVTS